jgi:hypothetical protein
MEKLQKEPKVLDEQKIESALARILDCIKKWFYHVDRMQRDRLSKINDEVQTQKQETKNCF